MSIKERIEELKEAVESLEFKLIQEKAIISYFHTYFMLDGARMIEVFHKDPISNKYRSLIYLDEEDLRKLLRAVKPWWKFW